MALRYTRRHYEQCSDFERVRTITIRKIDCLNRRISHNFDRNDILACISGSKAQQTASLTQKVSENKCNREIRRAAPFTQTMSILSIPWHLLVAMDVVVSKHAIHKSQADYGFSSQRSVSFPTWTKEVSAGLVMLGTVYLDKGDIHRPVQFFLQC